MNRSAVRLYMLDDAVLRDFPRARKSTRMISLCSNTTAPRALLVHRLEDKNRAAILLAQKDALPDDFPAGTCAMAAPPPPLQHRLNLEDTGRSDHFYKRSKIARLPPTLPSLADAPPSRLHFQSAYHALMQRWSSIQIPPADWGRAETDRRFGTMSKHAGARHILERDPMICGTLESLKHLATDFSRWPEARIWSSA